MFSKETKSKHSHKIIKQILLLYIGNIAKNCDCLSCKQKKKRINR